MNSLISAQYYRRLVGLATLLLVAQLWLGGTSTVASSSSVVQETSASTSTSTVIAFPGNSGPLNTGVYVQRNDFISITATGEIFNGQYYFTPDGALAPPDPQYGQTILPNIASNSLVGSIGDFAMGTLLDDSIDVNPSGMSGDELGYPGLFGPGYVGSSFRTIAAADGYIYLAFNDIPLNDNTGSFEVNIAINEGCAVPFFSQRDSSWENHPLRTKNGVCSSYCSIIGHCGCTLTSATMVFNSYGANTNPPQLSDCMDTSACPFSWNTGLSCSNGKVNHVSRLGFSWGRLDKEINLNHRPVILGMCKMGTCYLDYDDDPNTYAQTHWVVVLSGQGTNPEDYLINDPWFKCGANIPLATRSEDWQFVWMSVYEGTIPCSSLTAIIPPCVNRGANPQPVQFGSNLNNTYSQMNASPSSVVSGTVWIYTRTQLTMTVEITATSSVGTVTDMLIWTDTTPNTTWQSITPFVWLPVSEYVYARFRDDLGNVSEVYSDTINPIGPPNALFGISLPLIKR